jgi:hypothetical protein
MERNGCCFVDGDGISRSESIPSKLSCLCFLIFAAECKITRELISFSYNRSCLLFVVVTQRFQNVSDSRGSYNHPTVTISTDEPTKKQANKAIQREKIFFGIRFVRIFRIDDGENIIVMWNLFEGLIVPDVKFSSQNAVIPDAFGITLPIIQLRRSINTSKSSRRLCFDGNELLRDRKRTAIMRRERGSRRTRTSSFCGGFNFSNSSNSG